MDKITKIMKCNYASCFKLYGATAKGVDWNDESELLFRYDKMLAVINKDFKIFTHHPSFFDVGCGWGGLLRRARSLGINIDYSGIDVVNEMIIHGKNEFPEEKFICGDFLDIKGNGIYDFVVCNAILTQRYNISIQEMEKHSKKIIKKMFKLCRHGIAFNMMSTRVNYMVDNLYYQNPSEILNWIFFEISPRVVIDHGYSSLINKKGKFYDFTVYIYKG